MHHHGATLTGQPTRFSTEAIARTVAADAVAAGNAARYSRPTMPFSPPSADLTPAEVRDARAQAGADGPFPAPSDSWPRSYDDPFPTAHLEIVEVDRSDLDVDVLGGAVQHHGALLVRSLLAPDDVDRSIELMRLAQAQQARHFDGEPSDDGWFVPLQTAIKRDAVMRRQNADTGIVWMADSPNATERYLEILHRNGVIDLLAGFFGEPALFSLQKSTLRNVEPEHQITTWHQDGSFMGADIHTMNLWVALTDCGGTIPASGMEMIPRRMEEILDTEGGIVPHAIPFETVDDIAETTGVVNPEFRAGDAMFFDAHFLHRTALGPDLTQPRLAIESWFFGASAFADGYTRLLA